MSETTRSRPRLDYSALLRSAKATPKPGFSGWWSYIEFQPDIFSPQRFPIGVVVQADDERLYFKLLDDFKKFDCVYPEGFPHSSAKALMAYAYGVLQAAIKEKTPLSQILFDSHVLSLSRPVHTSGSDREAAVERLFSDVVAMVPSNVKKVREFASIDTAAARKLVNEKLKEIAAIKPCPFCGVTDVGFHEGSTFRWVFAHCKNCGARAPEVRRDTLTSDEDADLSEALEEWNRRDGK